MNNAKHAKNLNGMTNENIKVMPTKLDPIDEARERQAAIDKMIDGREEKLRNARAHLVDNLEVTTDKYRTANGVMAALEIVRSVAGKDSGVHFTGEIEIAKGCAIEMSAKAARMAKLAGELPIDKLDKLCEGFYAESFAEQDSTAEEFVIELMTLSLCQNVGPNAQDIIDFANSSEEEIDKAQREFEEFVKEHNLKLEDLSEA